MADASQTISNQEDDAADSEREAADCAMSGTEADDEGNFGVNGAAATGLLSLSSSSSDDSDSSDDMRKSAMAASLEDVKRKTEEIMTKPKPTHSWSLVKELHKRQLGERPSLLHQDKFRLHMYSSLHAVERLELMSKLCWHESCVNCLHFNATGSLLASGSDDLNVVVWDWQRKRPSYSYHTGHKSNIFEAKFMPLHNDTHIVSTSRDGQVRLAEISSAGECRSIRRLAQHRGSGRKLALQRDSPHTVLSCGEDAVVFSIDVRQNKPNRLTTCMDSGKKVPTNSIATHPEDGNVFLLACVDKFVRLYDRRMMGNDEPYRRLCPHRLLESGYRYSVTCGVFNYNGTEIVASYNDEDVYLFDASHSDGADCIHQYSGHRNNATIKGVNFFGPTSQYVLSGSDCGNIFVWDRDTEAIVQCVPGDENGVVNCLEPHPFIPVLATSGLDDDVKIWVPSRDGPPELGSLRQTVETNLRDRVDGDSPSTGSLGSSLMWTVMQQVLGSQWQRQRRQMFDMDTDDPDGRSSDSDDDQPGECRPT
ncbi:DDB1- and CUL4-associated factor 8-like [Pollicipes pollicipes]|uniref:DDB1- and CUL4-associated factor 8-like n=1 Tax=Pollicipes pollicipes TaxID=41117 RepID=UPI0018856C65|nr:DDB1- and CUL4-associated factor 8-like [Pollicipes pollicipes]